MKKILFSVLVLTSFNAIAETTQCFDTKTGGSIVKVIIDWNNNIMRVNGKTIGIQGEDSNGIGIVSYNFQNNYGQVRYYSMIYSSNETWIGQMDPDKWISPGESRASGGVYQLTCSRSFIEPFLKHKYS